jgi:tetratricopeptide (TPR) repeat protein
MQRYQARIFPILMDRFDESELRTLCFNLGVDYDVLAGSGKADKARELISFLNRRNSIAELISVAGEMRPDIDWKPGETHYQNKSEAVASPQDRPPSGDLLKTALTRLGHPAFVFHRPELENQARDYVLRGIHPVTLIQGLPGAGKTTMLGEIAISVHESYSNFCAVKFAGPSALEPFYFIEEINQFLTCLDVGIDPSVIRTLDAHRSLQTISDHIARLDHAILFLDAVDQAPSGLIDSLLRMLPPQTKIVMTARSRVVSRTNAQILAIPPLQENEALEFVGQRIKAQGMEMEDKSWVARLPKRIKESPQALTLFIANVSDIPLDLLLMDELSGLTVDLSSLVQTIIPAVTKDVSQALALLLLLEDLDLSKSFKVLNFSPPKGFPGALQFLLEKSLIYRQNESYRVPTVVREAVTSTMPDVIDDTVRELVLTLRGVINHRSPQEAYNQLADLSMLTADVLYRLSEFKYYNWILTLATEEFLEQINVRGFWKEYWLILRLIFEAAKELNDVPAFTLSGFRIIRKSFQVKDLQFGRQILAELENTLEIAPDTRLQAEFLSHKALFTEQDDQIQAALEELQESLRIYQNLNENESMSLVLKLMGNIYVRQHETSKARESYNLALSQLGHKEQLSKHAIEVELSLALCDYTEREFDIAQNRLRENIKKCREIGYLAGMPRAYYFLALVLESQNQYDEALHFAKMAAELALKTERSVAAGARVLIWKIKNQDFQEMEDMSNEG